MAQTQVGLAKDGTDITTPTAMPAGGAGMRGWLSAIWTKLNGSLAVTGTFWQATQPVSVTSLPLPTGAALDATLTGGTQTSRLTDGTNAVGVAGSTTAASETAVDRLKVNAALRLLDTAQSSGSQLVAAKGDQTSGLWANVKASVLPTGASTAAKQPALGTAGTASTDVITVQGIASGVAQPISATSLPLPTGATTAAGMSDGTARVQVRSPAAFAVTPAGTNKFFAASTGRSSAASTTAAVIAALSNPSGSGIDVYVDRVKMSAGTAGTFEHFRQGTLSGIGAAQASVDRSGNSGSSTAHVYISANVTATGGTSEDVYFLAANVPFELQPNGEERLQPGQNIYFTFTAAGVNTSSLNISFQWREVTAGSN